MPNDGLTLVWDSGGTPENRVCNDGRGGGGKDGAESDVTGLLTNSLEGVDGTGGGEREQRGAPETDEGRRGFACGHVWAPKVCEIRLALRKWLGCGNSVIEGMAGNMILKFDKYWDVINYILAVASILDSRKKLECVSFYFHLIYGNGYEFECDRIKRSLVNLVDDYKGKMHFINEASSSRTMEFDAILRKRSFDEIDDCENFWEKHVLQARLKRSCKSEVDVYLDEERSSLFNMGFPRSLSTGETVLYILGNFECHRREVAFPPPLLPSDYEELCSDFVLAKAEEYAREYEVPELLQEVFLAMLLNDAVKLGVLRGWMIGVMESALKELRWSTFQACIGRNRG
ncbi:hypothetical protein Cgig2_006524 [Carnegiea gigantea]|uniref:hAT-like transposase RNase-H fold domain-containing protein n=1 Tax=Carnegiea gigantea TaxID=171969 RepID=A0A9Q1GX83_9CARY|nr:hypothetical protein Cgig2_006524 [Carnegiea gigantea]